MHRVAQPRAQLRASARSPSRGELARRARASCRSRSPPIWPAPTAREPEDRATRTIQTSPNEKSPVADEPEAEHERQQRAERDHDDARSASARGRARSRSAARCAGPRTLNAPASTPPPRKRNAPRHVEREQPLREVSRAPSVRSAADGRAANGTCSLLTETIEAVNSTLDLEEVLSLGRDEGRRRAPRRRVLRLPLRRARRRARAARDARHRASRR